jgi:hypothetical protein
MKGEDHLKIENEPFMALHIERLCQQVELDGYGLAELYSLAHYYTLNGDLMSDPEMTFFVIAGEKGIKDSGKVTIIPRSFCQSDMGIYEESVIFLGPPNAVTNQNMQFQHAEFADVWLGNIREQKYLERL